MFSIFRFTLQGCQRRMMAVLFIATVTSLLIAIGEPLAQRTLINQGLMQGDIRIVLIVSLGLACLGQVLCVLSFFQGNLIRAIKNESFRRICGDTARHFLDLNYEKYAENDPGYHASRIAEETRTLAESSISLAVSLFTDSLSLILAIGFCLYISWKLTLVSLLICPVLYFMGTRFSKDIKHVTERERDYLAAYRGSTARFVAAFKTIRLFSLEPVALRALDQDFQHYARESTRRTHLVLKFSAWSRSLLSSSESIFLIFAALAVCYHELTLGDYFAYASVFWKIMPSVRSLSHVLPQLSSIRVLHERITEMRADAQKRAIYQTNGDRVKLDDVTLGYATKPVLSKVNLAIEPGEQVFLRGPNGGGKSSLAHVLCGLKGLQSGQRSIPDSVSAQLSAAHFFKGTLRDHLQWDQLPGDAKQELEALLNDFFLWDKLDRDPQEFSDGEKKKAMLAMTLMRPSKFYIFDEPFAALDQDSKPLVYQWIRHKTHDAAVLIIAHGDEDLLLDRKRDYVLDSGTVKVAFV